MKKGKVIFLHVIFGQKKIKIQEYMDGEWQISAILVGGQVIKKNLLSGKLSNGDI